MDRPADQIRKLVGMAIAGGPEEAAIARRKACQAIAKLDTELLDTLAGQRARLLGELREESRRLWRAGERATKADTGELVSSALVLFQHYERLDALLPAVLLLRLEDGQEIPAEDRERLQGPTESFLDRWSAEMRERRRAEREKRKKARRAAAGANRG